MALLSSEQVNSIPPPMGADALIHLILSQGASTRAPGEIRPHRGGQHLWLCGVTCPFWPNVAAALHLCSFVTFHTLSLYLFLIVTHTAFFKYSRNHRMHQEKSKILNLA
jgi:hypothetical protein